MAQPRPSSRCARDDMPSSSAAAHAWAQAPRSPRRRCCSALSSSSFILRALPGGLLCNLLGGRRGTTTATSGAAASSGAPQARRLALQSPLCLARPARRCAMITGQGGDMAANWPRGHSNPQTGHVVTVNVKITRATAKRSPKRPTKERMRSTAQYMHICGTRTRHCSREAQNCPDGHMASEPNPTAARGAKESRKVRAAVRIAPPRLRVQRCNSRLFSDACKRCPRRDASSILSARTRRHQLYNRRLAPSRDG